MLYGKKCKHFFKITPKIRAEKVICGLKGVTATAITEGLHNAVRCRKRNEMPV